MVTDNVPVIAQGQWMYDKSKICNLKIIKSNILYGTGDYDDEPEVRERDRLLLCVI